MSDKHAMDGNIPAPLPANERERLLAVHHTCILDTPPEPVFDDLTTLAAALFGSSIVAISIVDEHRQFFKSVVGLDVNGTSRDSSFCGYAILDNTPMVVLDARLDERFARNELVVGEPYIRFYAGAPMMDRNGMSLGSFCIIGREPRTEFSEREQALLGRFASLATQAIEQRLYPAQMAQTEEELLQAHERFQLVTRATTDGIWDWDLLDGRLYFSARLQQMIGLPAVDCWGRMGDWLRRLHPEDEERAHEMIQWLRTGQATTFESEYRMQHEDGSWRWVQNRGRSIYNEAGTLVRLAGAATDITERRMTDALTGLHSRASLLQELELRMAAQRKGERGFALLLIDSDDLTRIHDSMGHIAGKAVRVELGRRLKRILPGEGGSLAARLSGNVFAVLLNGVEAVEDALTFANLVRFVLVSPVRCGTRQVEVCASVGVAMSDPGYVRAEHLLSDADMASHQAKENGKGQNAVFDEGLRQQALERMTLESELRDAVGSGKLRVYYQPKLSMTTGELIGFESLLRWPHAERGFISPDRFIPVAEESELILEIGRFTLHESIRQLAVWRSAGLVTPTTTIAVNLSTKQFADRQLVANIVRRLVMYDVPSSCLTLEVTEGVLIRDSDTALVVLQELKRIGVKLDLDDFGTGYSSLSYLQRFPFDSLKVDRSFVRDLGIKPASTAILEAITALAGALRLRVVAEGIETPTQASVLRALGCQEGQGYLFSRPLPPEAIEEWLRREAGAVSGLATSPMFWVTAGERSEKAGTVGELVSGAGVH